MVRWLRFSRLAVVATLGLASPAWSDILDQSQPTPIGGMWRFARTTELGSTGATFTAGLTGPLTRVAIGLGRVGDPGTLTLTLFSTNAAGLPLAVLGSKQVPSADVAEYQDDGGFPLFTIDVEDLRISVTTGTRYAYGLATSTFDGQTNFLMVAGTEGDVYDNGGYWVTGQQGPYIYPEHDGVFQTWVQAAVPAVGTTWGAVKALYR